MGNSTSRRHILLRTSISHHSLNNLPILLRMILKYLTILLRTSISEPPTSIHSRAYTCISYLGEYHVRIHVYHTWASITCVYM